MEPDFRVSRISSGKRENIPEKVTLYERYIRGGCEDVLQEFGPDAHSHQAAQMAVRRSVRELSFDADVNIIGTLGLLEDCVRFGVEKVLFASTGGAIRSTAYAAEPVAWISRPATAPQSPAHSCAAP